MYSQLKKLLFTLFFENHGFFFHPRPFPSFKDHRHARTALGDLVLIVATLDKHICSHTQVHCHVIWYVLARGGTRCGGVATAIERAKGEQTCKNELTADELTSERANEQMNARAKERANERKKERT